MNLRELREKQLKTKSLNTSMTTLSTSEKALVQELVLVVKTEYSTTKHSAYKIDENGNYHLPLHWMQANIPRKFVYNNTSTNINVPTPEITLRPNQIECVDACLSELKKDFGGGIINLSTGAGKTIISLYLIGHAKLKTLIVVNKVELLNQWKAALAQFFPDLKVGIVQGSKFEKECDICIGMLQTISLKSDYTAEHFKEFTLCFIDEVHNTPSEMFSQALHKIRNKYVFGLSATIERKDGLEKIFLWHIGPVIFSDKKTSSKQQTIFKKISFSGGSSKEVELYNGKLNVSQMLTNLATDEARTEVIYQTLSDLEEDRRVLVLSDRICQLKKLHGLLGDEKSGLFIGKCTTDEREASKKKKILLATYAMASEGFNHPELNTLLFATPRSTVTQAIGRIYRKQHDIQPMIIDIVDAVGIFYCQYTKRNKIYKKEIGPGPDELEKKMNGVCLFD